MLRRESALKSSWLVTLPILLFSLGSLALSVSYARDHSNGSLPAFLVYSGLGILGLLVSIVLIIQHRAISRMETALKEKCERSSNPQFEETPRDDDKAIHD